MEKELPVVEFANDHDATLTENFQKNFGEWKETPWGGGPFIEYKRSIKAWIPKDKIVDVFGVLVWGEVLINEIKEKNFKQEFSPIKTMIIPLGQSYSIPIVSAYRSGVAGNWGPDV